MRNANCIVNRNSSDIMQDVSYIGDLELSKDEQNLFFRFKKESKTINNAKPVPGAATLNIWSYRDYILTEPLPTGYTDEQNREDIGVVSLKSHAITVLTPTQTETELFQIYDQSHPAYFICGVKSKGGIFEMCWDTTKQPNCYP